MSPATPSMPPAAARGQALHALASPQAFAARYGVPPETPPLLFAVGDGNHSLATAKSIWDSAKATVGMGHPSRYALVEVVNLHDAALEFAPIHRLLFGVRADVRQALADAFGGRLQLHRRGLGRRDAAARAGRAGAGARRGPGRPRRALQRARDRGPADHVAGGHHPGLHRWPDGTPAPRSSTTCMATRCSSAWRCSRQCRFSPCRGGQEPAAAPRGARRAAAAQGVLDGRGP